MEVPGILYAGFRHTLRRIQDQFVSDDEFAFLSTVAPSSPESSPHISPPYYTEDKEFSFQLDCLRRKETIQLDCPYTLRPNDLLSSEQALMHSIDKLCESTTLDRGQATALCENLCRGLAFTQGPPGTGKT